MADFEGMDQEQQQYEAKLLALRLAIDDGVESGVAEGDVFRRVRETLNLPAKPG
jgi:hypothetical protein